MAEIVVHKLYEEKVMMNPWMWYILLTFGI